jgi:hypothetical protein
MTGGGGGGVLYHYGNDTRHSCHWIAVPEWDDVRSLGRRT